MGACPAWQPRRRDKNALTPLSNQAIPVTCARPIIAGEGRVDAQRRNQQPSQQRPPATPFRRWRPSPFRLCRLLAGVRLSTGRGRRPLQGPHRRTSGRFVAGHAGRRRVHQVQDGLGARRVVQSQSEERQRPRPGRQQRQCQRLHRQGRVRGCATDRRVRCRRRRLPGRARCFMASTGVIGEPLPAGKITKILGTLAEAGCGRRVARRGRSHHDDRHLSQDGDRLGDDRRQARHASTASPKVRA